MEIKQLHYQANKVYLGHGSFNIPSHVLQYHTTSIQSNINGQVQITQNNCSVSTCWGENKFRDSFSKSGKIALQRQPPPFKVTR